MYGSGNEKEEQKGGSRTFKIQKNRLKQRMSFKSKGKMWMGRVRNQIFLAIIIQVIRMEMMRRNNKYFVINIIESMLSTKDMQE